MEIKHEHVKYLFDRPGYHLKIKNGKPIIVVDKKRKRAIFVSYFDKEKHFIKIGWALCAKRDRFNNKEGLSIARGRCSSIVNLKSVPDSIKKEFENFAASEKEYWSNKYEGAGLWNYKN